MQAPAAGGEGQDVAARAFVAFCLRSTFQSQTSTKNRQLRETAASLQNWCLKADQETSHLLKEATNNFVLSNATDEDREVKEPMKQQKKHR